MTIDVSSETWKSVKEVCERGIEYARFTLEGIECSDSNARIARGEIAAFRAVLNLRIPNPTKNTIDPTAPRIRTRAGI